MYFIYIYIPAMLHCSRKIMNSVHEGIISNLWLGRVYITYYIEYTTSVHNILKTEHIRMTDDCKGI